MLRFAHLSLLLIWPAAVWANPVCTALAEQEASLGQGGAQCAESDLLGGGIQTTCYWAFEYRSAEAQAWLADAKAQIEGCMGAEARLPEDAQVNHPDSFVLYEYEGQGQRVALSLKDKAGQSKSLVFLSISSLP